MLLSPRFMSHCMSLIMIIVIIVRKLRPHMALVIIMDPSGYGSMVFMLLLNSTLTPKNSPNNKCSVCFRSTITTSIMINGAPYLKWLIRMGNLISSHVHLKHGQYQVYSWLGRLYRQCRKDKIDKIYKFYIWTYKLINCLSLLFRGNINSLLEHIIIFLYLCFDM